MAVTTITTTKPTSSFLSIPYPKTRTLHFGFCPQKPRSQFVCCLSVDRPTCQSPSGQSDASALRVVFATGGTGGRIYPAVAIADEIKMTNPDAQILFIGTDSGMESTIVPSAGYDFAPVPASPLARSMFSLQTLILPFYLVRSMVESWKIIKEFKPQIVFGTGCSVSFPICLVAALNGLRVIIHEHGSVPGSANWVLSLFADLVFVAYNSTVDCFPTDKKKIVVSGNPVRLSLKKFVSKAVGRSYFFPRLAKVRDSDAKVVLVLGGSMGANSMNIALLNFYQQLLLERENLYIIWETGVGSFDEMENLVRNHPQLVLAPFLHAMDLAYAAADLVVSRAGAMTCTELLATGKPAILIPSPNIEEGHQFKNASLMADLAGSRIITEDELDSCTLRYAMEDILDNEQLMTTMSERAFQAAKPNAGAEIANHLISLVNASPKK
uniref:Undecaprenyldiphospho-muramoylpentapeptide beta-N-acetylglucosaminyltransferase n=1 Tax=Opuntia streptacantha TaxID=393608 RepID=A0A7C9AY62_OPUST